MSIPSRGSAACAASAEVEGEDVIQGAVAVGDGDVAADMDVDKGFDKNFVFLTGGIFSPSSSSKYSQVMV